MWLIDWLIHKLVHKLLLIKVLHKYMCITFEWRRRKFQKLNIVCVEDKIMGKREAESMSYLTTLEIAKVIYIAVGGERIIYEHQSSWHYTEGKTKLIGQNLILLLLCPQTIIWTRLGSILELHDEMLTSNRMRHAILNYPKVFNRIEKFTLGNCSYQAKTHHCFTPVDCYSSALEVVVRKEYSTFSCKNRVEFLKAIIWIKGL